MLKTMSSITKRRGRPPRPFDRTAALDAAMHVFWAKGFDRASITDLCSAMDVHPPTLYAAFGTKEDLFRESCARYIATEGGAAVRSLENPVCRTAIREMLMSHVDVLRAYEKGRGCMVVTSSSSIDPTHELWTELSALRRGFLENVAARRDKGKRDGEVGSSVDTKAVALLLVSLLNGFSVQMLDGVDRSPMAASIDSLMHSWCALVNAPHCELRDRSEGSAA